MITNKTIPKGSYIGNFRAYEKLHILPQKSLIDLLIKFYARKQSCQDEEAAKDEYKKLFERLGAYKHLNSRQSLKTIPELLDQYNDTNKGHEERLHQSLIEITEDLMQKDLHSEDNMLDSVILTTTTATPFSPSPLQEVLSKFNSDAKHLHLYHMDCYAALPTLATADAFAKALPLHNGAKQKHITVLHEELSSSYFRSSRRLSTGNLLCDSLFADGCIAYDVTSQKTDNYPTLELTSVNYKQWKNSIDYISICHRTGDVSLHKKLAELVGECCNELMSSIKLSMDSQELHADNVHVAVHAGGPSLLNVVQDTLNLRDDQMRFAWSVLKSKGNMESATVVYQLKDIIEEKTVKDGDYVLLLAFGPGITAGFASFKVHKPVIKEVTNMNANLINS